MKVVRIEKQDWRAFSERAHLIVFNEKKNAETDRIDFALVVENEFGIPMTYVTCQERDSESLYWQYGGSFPGTKGTVFSLSTTLGLIEWCRQFYKRVSFLVENTNHAMLKLAMKCGFLVIGLRNYKEKILLEHFLEFA